MTKGWAQPDVEWIRSSNLFKYKMEEFNNKSNDMSVRKDFDNIDTDQSDLSYFKAIIRVVKSLAANDTYTGGFDTVDVVREPLIRAKDKDEVKRYLLSKYPQFFQNGKIYERETKDTAQFFYVVIFPLYDHEILDIKEGQWICDYCGHVHQNRYLSRPLTSRKFEGRMFCGSDYKTGNDIVEATCYEKWKKEVYFKNTDLPDNLAYINENSLNYIYKCTEKSSGKCYIGKTRNAPFFRWWNHLNHSNSPFGQYLRSTKLSDWTFEVLEELPSDIEDTDIFRIESEYIVKFDSINNGYNSLISNRNAIPPTPSSQLKIEL